MSIPMTIAGHHVEVTPPMKDYVTEKLGKLERAGTVITHMAVTLSVEKLQQTAKAVLHIKGHEIFASHEAPDMYAAIDGLHKKLEHQLKKHHDRITHH